MESAAAFARAESIQVMVHDLGFFCLESMEDFLAFNHANFAL